MTTRRLVGLLAALMLPHVPAASAQQAVGNPHGDLPEGVTCTSCHTTEGWTPLRRDVQFDHAQTGFPLDGRHSDATCARCHAGLVFDQIDVQPGDCGSCHVDVHEGSIARPCESCHTTTSFSDLDPAAVHPADFPLEGAHLQTSCESCHTNDLGGAYRPLNRECVTCHMADYASSTLVDHRALGFSTTCTECHSVLGFRDVAFDHFELSGGFELIGAHMSIDCTSCHNGPSGGVTTSPRDAQDCVACHSNDYDREHQGTGFPTDCVFCHNPFRWDDANFDHSFPIFSGSHAGRWDTCADCHEVPGDFGAFTCITCHQQSETDSHHRDVRNYSYDSQSCLSCHPTGRGGD